MERQRNGWSAVVLAGWLMACGGGDEESVVNDPDVNQDAGTAGDGTSPMDADDPDTDGGQGDGGSLDDADSLDGTDTDPLPEDADSGGDDAEAGDPGDIGTDGGADADASTSDTDTGSDDDAADGGLDAAVPDCSACDPEALCTPADDGGVSCSCPDGAEGDGLTCVSPVQVLAFSASENLVVTGTQAKLSVATAHAESCTLSLDGVGVLATYDRAALDRWNAGELLEVAVEPDWWDVFRETTGTTYLQFRLNCQGEPLSDGGANEALARLIVLLQNRPPLPVTLTGPSEPGGGTWEICWEQDELPSCRVRITTASGASFTVGVFGASGCASQDLLENSRVTVSCFDNVGDFWSRSTFVRVGPGIEAFSLMPIIVPAGGGPSMAAWDSVGVDSCELRQDDDTLAIGASGEAVVEVPATGGTTLVLTCGSDTRRGFATTPGIQEIGIQPEGENGYWVSHSSILTSNCVFTGTLGETPLRSPVVRAALDSWQVPLDPAVPQAPLNLTLNCDSPDGPYEATASYTPVVAQIERLDVTPTELPAGGGTVDVCWEATNADVCSLSYFDTSLPDLPTASCVSFDAFATSEVVLSCVGANGIPDEARQLVTVGPTVLSFTATPDELADVGEVELSWETVGTSGCTLQFDAGSPIRVPTSGTNRYVTEGTTSFTLTCEDESGFLTTASQTVWVGYDIGTLEVRYRGSDLLEIFWTAPDSLVCSLTVFNQANEAVYSLEPTPSAREGAAQPLSSSLVGIDGGRVRLDCASPVGPVSAERTIRGLVPPTLSAIPEDASYGVRQTVCVTGGTFDRCDLRTVDNVGYAGPTEGPFCVDIDRTSDLELVANCELGPGPEGDATGQSDVLSLPLLGASIEYFESSGSVVLPDTPFQLCWSSVGVVECTVYRDEGVALLPIGTAGASWCVATSISTAQDFVLECIPANPAESLVSTRLTVDVGEF